MSDLRHLQPTDELPVPPPPRRGPSRTVILVAGLVVLALVATLVFAAFLATEAIYVWLWPTAVERLIAATDRFAG